MANVNALNGIEYGFRLIGYLLGVLIVGVIIGLIGQAIGDVIGVLVSALGGLVVLAGVLGIQFKLVADGVERGVRAAHDKPVSEVGGSLRDVVQSAASSATNDTGGYRQGVKHPPQHGQGQSYSGHQQSHGEQQSPHPQGGQRDPDSRQPSDQRGGAQRGRETNPHDMGDDSGPGQ